MNIEVFGKVQSSLSHSLFCASTSPFHCDGNPYRSSYANKILAANNVVVVVVLYNKYLVVLR